MYSLLKSLEYFNLKADYVLAIIVDTQGSTYRKSGSMMLIREDLEYWGLLSGGCLESDIVIHCEKVFQQKKDNQINYNMRDEADLLWGMGLGCDGELTILLKYLPATNNHLDVFDGFIALKQGQSQRLSIDSKQANSISLEPLNNNNQNPSDQSNNLSFELIKPHHVLICGASPDVPPVTAIAHQIGWKTTVIDHRKDFAKIERFADADSVEHVKRSQWQEYDLSTFDSVIIMSHQFERDQEYLTRLLASEINYIGLLGPTKRRDKLLANCKTNFENQEGRVYGPIGLDIGASSPETIALAIISEIQAVKNNKKLAFCYQDSTR